MALALFLVFVALILIFLEAYLPASGLLGFLSACAFGVAIYLGFRAGSERGAPWIGWAFLLGVAVLVPLAIIVAVRTFPYTPMGKRLILDGAPRGEEARAAVDAHVHLIGKVGVALTDLRPFGAALFDGHRVEVSSEGHFLPKGTRVVVRRSEGGTLIVRTADADPPSGIG